MNIDNRLLIKQVEARPPLWNRFDESYGQKRVISKLWAEIAMFHRISELRLKGRWKSLRDMYRQELRKAERSTWSLFKEMSFLKDHVKLMQTKTKSNETKSDSEDAMEDMIMVKTEAEDNASTIVEEDEKAGESTAMTEVDAETPRRSDLESDDDYHFLMSFLQEIRRLEPRQKIQLKIKMLELFYAEIYQQNV